MKDLQTLHPALPSFPLPPQTTRRLTLTAVEGVICADIAEYFGVAVSEFQVEVAEYDVVLVIHYCFLSIPINLLGGKVHNKPILVGDGPWLECSFRVGTNELSIIGPNQNGQMHNSIHIPMKVDIIHGVSLEDESSPHYWVLLMVLYGLNEEMATIILIKQHIPNKQMIEEIHLIRKGLLPVNGEPCCLGVALRRNLRFEALDLLI